MNPCTLSFRQSSVFGSFLRFPQSRTFFGPTSLRRALIGNVVGSGKGRTSVSSTRLCDDRENIVRIKNTPNWKFLSEIWNRPALCCPNVRALSVPTDVREPLTRGPSPFLRKLAAEAPSGKHPWKYPVAEVYGSATQGGLATKLEVASEIVGRVIRCARFPARLTGTRLRLSQVLANLLSQIALLSKIAHQSQESRPAESSSFREPPLQDRSKSTQKDD